MPQIDNKFSAFFMDTTTAPGTPLTGLSATIIIKEADSPYTKVVDGEAMTETGDGEYVYVFNNMSATKDYTYQINPNSALAYITTGVTDKRINHIDTNLSELWVRWGGGFAPVNLAGLNTKLDQIYKRFESIPKEVDLTPVIKKIDAIDIPETKVDEKEAKKALKAIANLEKKLESFISEEKSDKEEFNSIAREFAKQEMIDMEKKALENKIEMDMMEEIKKEFDIQEKKFMEDLKKMEEEEKKKEMEQEKEDKRKELEEKKKEIESEKKELEKESKEIEKQLKKL